jgi:hypothetical protein
MRNFEETLFRWIRVMTPGKVRQSAWSPSEQHVPSTRDALKLNNVLAVRDALKAHNVLAQGKATRLGGTPQPWERPCLSIKRPERARQSSTRMTRATVSAKWGITPPVPFVAHFQRADNSRQINPGLRSVHLREPIWPWANTFSPFRAGKRPERARQSSGILLRIKP